jgi:hypothetical protein
MRRCLAFSLAAALLCGACGPAPGQGGDADGKDETKPVSAAKAAVAGMHAVNALCPMSGEAVSRAGGAVDMDGHTVAFCSRACAAEFGKLDEAGKLAALAKHDTALPK